MLYAHYVYYIDGALTKISSVICHIYFFLSDMHHRMFWLPGDIFGWLYVTRANSAVP